MKTDKTKRKKLDPGQIRVYGYKQTIYKSWLQMGLLSRFHGSQIDW